MNIFIVGGGVAGLATAWFIHKQNKEAQITLFEKENRLGGWIQTETKGEFFFERGPRTFPYSKSPHLLSLIQELKLPIISSDPQAAKRYILHRGRLRSLTYFLPSLIPYLIRELFIPPTKEKDESIYDFATRRFSPRIAETLFDPMTLGIYAGDSRKLSLRACFPLLHQWEQEKGSLLRGFFSSPKQTKGFFTLKKGMESLIQELAKRLPINIVFNAPAHIVNEQELRVGKTSYFADRIISALPPDVPKQSLWIVHIAYPHPVLNKKGIGYLVPTKEKEELLGVMFDSSLFPEQNRGQETRLTAMVRPEAKDPLGTALEALERHLNLSPKQTVFTHPFFAKEAIPQFLLGAPLPLEGVSVDAAIQRAERLSLKYLL